MPHAQAGVSPAGLGWALQGAIPKEAHEDGCLASHAAHDGAGAEAADRSPRNRYAPIVPVALISSDGVE